MGTEKDLVKAAHWFQQSAIGGNQDGMCLWAECLEKGNGTEKNDAEALKWYRKSAEAGCGKAKKRVAELERQSKPAS